MPKKTVTIFDRLKNLEKELQKLKVEVLFDLSQKEQKGLYPQQELLKAIRETRESIWQKRYAKKT